jgi:hypothetical protein
MEDYEDGHIDGSVTSDNAGGAKPEKLQLPPSCDPPGPGNPVKQMVWIVSGTSLLLLRGIVSSTFYIR